MISEKRLPPSYVLTPGDMLINRFHAISPTVEKAMKLNKRYSIYIGNSFTSYIWWDPRDSFWYAEIYQKGRYQLSRKSKEIQMLAFEIDISHGG